MAQRAEFELPHRLPPVRSCEALEQKRPGLCRPPKGRLELDSALEELDPAGSGLGLTGDLGVGLDRQESPQKNPEGTDNSRHRRAVHHRATNMLHDARRDDSRCPAEDKRPAKQRYD